MSNDKLPDCGCETKFVTLQTDNHMGRHPVGMDSTACQYPATLRTIEEQSKEIARLGECLNRGNDSMEECERSLYLKLNEAEEQIEALQGSMMRHFNDEHLAGDGPEIDRWKSKLRAVEAENERLRAALEEYRESK